MKKEIISDEKMKLLQLCNEVRVLVKNGEFIKGSKLIREAMQNYPHAPEPHNLFGMLLEKEGNHSLAMKHFRAAWALDPTYLPVRHNLEFYGTFFSHGKGAYDEDDCPDLEESNRYEVEYDKNGVGHMVRRKE